MTLGRVVEENLHEVVVDIANIPVNLLMIRRDGGFVDGSDFGQRGERTVLPRSGVSVVDDPAMEGLQGDGNGGVIGDNPDKFAGGKVGDR